MLIVILDFFTKELVKNKNLIIIKNILQIEYTKNYGIVYGILKSNIVFTIIIPLILFVLLIYFLIYKSNDRKLIIPVSLILAGIMGNLISRIKYGYVIDFIYIPLIQPIFPNFNIADMAAFIGTIFLAFYLLTYSNH